MAVDVLFQPLKLGALEAKNRIFLAPLTRNRAHADGRINETAKLYYEQRASAGLVITEATQISPLGKGYLDTPGIYTPEHVAAWRPVTEAVHAAGGTIVLQLWHVGRISHVSLLPPGEVPVSASAIPAATSRTFTAAGFEPVSAPRALTLSEIASTVDDYARAAANAKEAGFDGVEVHGANGYLLQQFLCSGSNARDDAYGGAVENRARFLFEAVEAAQRAIGADRVGVRIGPLGAINDALDADPDATFDFAARGLLDRGVAYIHLAGTVPGEQLDAFTRRTAALKRAPVIANGGYNAERAAEWVANGWADAVAFGVPFLANPDLPARIRQGAALNAPNQATFFGGGAEGYTDYPALSA
jgi:N-ethylmaleimide reductase